MVGGGDGRRAALPGQRTPRNEGEAKGVSRKTHIRIVHTKTYTHIHTHTYIHTNIHIRTQTYTHTYVSKRKEGWSERKREKSVCDVT